MSKWPVCEAPNVYAVGDQELLAYEAALIVIFGSFSAILCTAYLYFYYVVKAPWSRRHPGSLLAYRCGAELIFGLIFIIMPFSNINIGNDNRDRNDYPPSNRAIDDESKLGPNHQHGVYADDELKEFAFLKWKHHPTSGTKFLVFLVEWSIVSSELWFFCLGHDWYTSMSNPFASFKGWARYYQVLGFGLPLVMGLSTLPEEVAKGVTFFFVPWIIPECAEQMIFRFDLRENRTLTWPHTKKHWNSPIDQINGTDIKYDYYNGKQKPYDDDNMYVQDDDNNFVLRQWGMLWTKDYKESSMIVENKPKKGCDHHKFKHEHKKGNYTCQEFFSLKAIGFLWVFIVVIYIYNLYVMYYAHRRLKRGTQNTQKEREQSLQRSKTIIYSSCAYWITPLVLMAGASWGEDNDKQSSSNYVNHCVHGKFIDPIHQVSVAVACMLALRGSWSVLTVFWIFRKEMWLSNEEQVENMANETEALTPHLNAALRAEVLQYSTLCIRLAIVRHELEDEPGDEESGSRAFELTPPEYSAVDQARQEFEYILPSAEVETMKESPTYQKEMENQEVEMHPERLANRMTLRMNYDPTFLRGSQVIVPRASQTLRSSMVEAHRNTGNPIHTDTITDEPREPSKGRIQSLTRAISTRSISTTSNVLRMIFSDDSSVRFYDYNPQVFVEIRKMVGINPKDYHDSWESTTGANFSEGAGGAFMFFSKDRKYMAKTLTESAWYAEGEAETLMKMLMDYKEHLKSNGPASMLVRILGLHCMEIYGKKIYFMVQNNVFPPEAKMDMVYDLKGSWVNRQVGSTIDNIAVDEKWSHIKKGKTEKGSTLKDSDLNFVFLTSEHIGMKVGKQIDRDISFLRDHQIMDYSLLVGVRNADFARDQEGEFDFNRDDKTGRVLARKVKGPDEYYFGLIDILQEWNWPKWIERKTKTILLCKDKKGVSAIEPDDYKDRFMARVVYAKIKGANPRQAGEEEGNDERRVDVPSGPENGVAVDNTDTSDGFFSRTLFLL